MSETNGAAMTSAPAPIAIVGGGGMGREAAAWAEAAGMNVAGVIDDNLLVGAVVGGLPVLGGVGDLLDNAEVAAAVVAIGAPEVRKRVMAQLRAAGVPLQRIIHPSARVGSRVHVGDGCIVGPNTTITVDGRLDEGVILNYGAQVGHDAVIGACVFIGPGVAMAGNVTLGQCVEVGINATLIQGVTVGDETVIGAGAVVLRSLPARVTAVGVPARIIKRHEA